MIKALLAVVALVAAFAVGVAGVYFAMPTLAPGKVERAQAYLDSLALVDSLAWAYSQGFPADTTARPPDSLAMARPWPDSLAVAISMPEDQPPPDAALEADTSGGGAVLMSLQDSLTSIQHRFEQLEREKTWLIEQVKSLKKQVEAQQARGGDVEALSATLAKLEDKELAGVVEKLDADVLEALYEKASVRNRTRLLQAMPPDAAAGFVRRLVRPNKAVVTSISARSDTVAGSAVLASEPQSINQ